MTRILIIFLFTTFLSFGQNSGIRDSLLCNIKNNNSDRLLLYDKDCFIWIKQETIADQKNLSISYGQFKILNDTIYFTFPDSTHATNKYYCYCKYEGHDYKGFQLYNIPETWPPGSTDRVYKDLFNAKTPNLTEFTTLIHAKAVIKKDKVIFITGKSDDHLINEYVFCNKY